MRLRAGLLRAGLRRGGRSVPHVVWAALRHRVIPRSPEIGKSTAMASDHIPHPLDSALGALDERRTLEAQSGPGPAPPVLEVAFAEVLRMVGEPPPGGLGPLERDRLLGVGEARHAVLQALVPQLAHAMVDA